MRQTGLLCLGEAGRRGGGDRGEREGIKKVKDRGQKRR